MNKKAISLILLLLANMAMLVHFIIPHHYHHDHHHEISAVCFMTVHCTDIEEAQKHSYDSDCHKCDDGRLEKCSVKEAYRRSGSHKLTADPRPDDCNCHPALLSANSTVKPAGLEGLSLRPETSSPSCYTDYISNSFGTRAPPRSLV